MRRSDYIASNIPGLNAWASGSDDDDSGGDAYKEKVDPMDFVSVDAMNNLKLSQMSLSSRPGAKGSAHASLEPVDIAMEKLNMKLAHEEAAAYQSALSEGNEGNT